MLSRELNTYDYGLQKRWRYKEEITSNRMGVRNLFTDARLKDKLK